MTELEVGVVTRPHGVRGEVRVAVHWAGSDALDRAEHVALMAQSGDRARYAVEAARRASKHVLLKLAGVDDRDAAEALRGARVLVDRAALGELDPDEFYLADLIGCEVRGPAGRLGKVVEVRSHSTVDTIVIELGDGSRAEQPLVEPWLGAVDVDERVVELTTLDGLIQ